MKTKVDFSEFWCVNSEHVRLYDHIETNSLCIFILVSYCWEVWGCLMRGAPGVTLEGDGVTHEAEGLLLRGGGGPLMSRFPGLSCIHCQYFRQCIQPQACVFTIQPHACGCIRNPGFWIQPHLHTKLYSHTLMNIHECCAYKIFEEK